MSSASDSLVEPGVFRMPAEWEPQAGIWLVWPHAADTWPGCLDQAEREHAGLARAIAEFEPVDLLVPDSEQLDRIERAFAATSTRHPVRLHVVPSDDSWVRDSGPTFVHDAAGSVVAIDWIFNAWGGKYAPWDRDAAVGRKIAELADVRCIRSSLTLEGGALEVDGEGTLLATRSCVLDPKRNPEIAEKQIEAILAPLLGIERFIWVDASLSGDDTDGHIDNLARFVAPGRVLCSVATQATHPDHDSLRALYQELARSRDARGRLLEVIELPLPAAVEVEERLLPASYANFLILNGGVVVPNFGVDTDAAANDLLRKCFPDRRIVGVEARTLVRGFGGPHCLSQQQPASRSS